MKIGHKYEHFSSIFLNSHRCFLQVMENNLNPAYNLPETMPYKRPEYHTSELIYAKDESEKLSHEFYQDLRPDTQRPEEI